MINKTVLDATYEHLNDDMKAKMLQYAGLPGQFRI